LPIRLIPLQQAVKQYVPQGVSLVGELVKARREEAGGELLFYL
jgi:hypothetical protein